uniref:CD276 antigen n=1 Tax=Strix occidentalis caurina TaxID=311401 RepID=A0A8D0FGU8_STROC
MQLARCHGTGTRLAACRDTLVGIALEHWCHLAPSSPATVLPRAGSTWGHGTGSPLPSPADLLSPWGETRLRVLGGCRWRIKEVLLQVLTTTCFYPCHPPAGAMEIQVPDEPVVALFGRDATLRCSFSPEANFSLDDLSLIWQLTDTKRLVHSFSGGQDQLADQGGGYANRTALFYDQLAQGNVSLLLRRVEISDEGSFTCFVRVRDYSSAAVTLQVAAPYSKPNMNLEPNKDLKPGDLAAVTCHASRGYPEASVLWQDSRGSNITENITTSQVANEEGLFDVHSVLQVLVEPSSTYSCLVRNPVLQQETHASVTITGQHLAFPAVALWLTVGLAICVVGLLAVLVYVCQKKIRQSREEEEENAEGASSTCHRGNAKHFDTQK